MTQPPFPSQDPTCPWPTEAWPRGALPESLDQDTYERAYDALTQPEPENGECYAVLVIHRGRLVGAPETAPRQTAPSSGPWAKASSRGSRPTHRRG